MKTSAYILKEVGVKVSWESARGRNRATGEEYAYARRSSALYPRDALRLVHEDPPLPRRLVTLV